MKKLFILPLFLALAATAQAQSSNLVQAIRLTYTDAAGATNNTTINLSSREAEGFFINYQKDIVAAGTNAPPTFQNSIRGTTQGFLLNILAEQARANDRKTNNVDKLFLYGPAFWDSVLTSQQRQDLKAIAAATNVTAAFPQ